MSAHKPLILKCPVCGKSLAGLCEHSEGEGADSKIYACENNHSFDVAKEGYLNLLLAQHMRSKKPGDSAEMIQSRQRFLNKAYYQNLSKAINDSLGLSEKSKPQNILEIGCGEGYYLQGLWESAKETHATVNLAGIDISKPAVKNAAKRKMDVQLSVSSAYQLPYFDQCFEFALSIFSPICPEEASRVLKDGGRIVMVGPDKDHLKGLVSHIYDETLPHEGNHLVLDDDERFQLSEERSLKQSIVVEGEDIRDLLRMTPYYWHTSEEKKEKLLALPTLETEIDFYIRVYSKC